MPQERPPPDVIDLEASGFGAGSYPIEAGFVTASGERYCALIRPAEHWVHWDAEAEAVHGISRDVLREHGRPPIEVARALNSALAGRTVYSDSWLYDFSWLSVLFNEAGLAPAFRLEHIYSLLGETERAAWGDAQHAVERELSLRRHRASSDALIVQKTWLRLTASDPAQSAGGPALAT